eukprot:TRINITY_DN12492_c0_g1_i1.p1 TRINITY_DN12492_c0_g1~~TRINITY_DN12492_c0_g1_i1.p1  ORF type:complete len:651 (+),score=118.94 TRINITY_DN12492_c0_g1_i1:58-1953(+)
MAASRVLLFNLLAGAPQGIFADDGDVLCLLQGSSKPLTSPDGLANMTEESDSVAALEASILPYLVARGDERPHAGGMLQALEGLVDQPVTSAVQDFAKKTRPLIGNLLEDIKGGHDNDTNLLREMYGGFDTAAGRLSKDTLAVEQRSNDVTTARANLNKCRLAESKAFNGTVTDKDALDKALAAAVSAKKLLLQSAKTMSAIGESQAGETLESIRALKSPAEDVQANTGIFLAALRDAESSVAQLSKADAAHKETKRACAKNQTALEGAACTHATEQQTTCTNYQSAYDTKVVDYEAVVKNTRPKEANRKTEFSTLKKIDCILSFLAATNESHGARSQIDNCFNKTVAVDHLGVTYNATPPARQCAAVPTAVPCNAAWIAQEYADLPVNTAADACSVQCPGFAATECVADSYAALTSCIADNKPVISITASFAVPEIQLTYDVVIQGKTGSEQITSSVSSVAERKRLFDVQAAKVTFKRLIMTNDKGGEGCVNVLDHTTDLEFEDVVFRNCHTMGWGGALNFAPNDNGASSVSFTRVQFYKNRIIKSDGSFSNQGLGGGVYAWASPMTFDQCCFEGNTAGNGAGIFAGGNGDFKVKITGSYLAEGDTVTDQHGGHLERSTDSDRAAVCQAA